MEKTQVRNVANGVFGVGLVLMLLAVYVALVFWENTIGFGAGLFAALALELWIILLAVLLFAALVILTILYFVHSGPRPVPVLSVACAVCSTPLEVTDTGQRPLPYTCPQCGTVGEIAGHEAPPAAQEAPAPEPLTPTPAPMVDAEVDALLVQCTNCQNEFELPYSTERPLHGRCPHCGEETILEEGEDVLGAADTPLLDVEGIGPVYARKLERAGVRTMRDLQGADAARLADETGIPETSLRSWQSMADLMRVAGIDKQFAELLVRSGIDGASDLARMTPEKVVTRVKHYVGSVKAPPTRKRVDARRARKWVQEARKLA